MSIIEEGDEPQIRMAYLAIVGSFSINGVAELHTRLLENGLFRNFYELWPDRFNNKTNGVTPRRWLAFCNPGLARLVTDRIGEAWVTQSEKLVELEAFSAYPEFRTQWQDIKQENKQALVSLVRERSGALDRPKLVVPDGTVGDGIVRIEADETTYHAPVDVDLNGDVAIRGLYDNARLARTGDGANHLAEWVDSKGLDAGRSALVDLVVEGEQYGLRAPGERAVYEVADGPDDSLAAIAEDLGE
jgi:hypothetical protein